MRLDSLEEQWGINFAQIGFDQSKIDSVVEIDALIHSDSERRSAKVTYECRS